jgi:hypothetical protein
MYGLLTSLITCIQITDKCPIGIKDKWENVGIGVQNSNCIKLFFLNCIILNIGHIYIIALHVQICLSISYNIHISTLSYIVFD